MGVAHTCYHIGANMPALSPRPAISCVLCVRPDLGGGFVVLFQALFFGFIGLTPYEGFYWMGATVICLAGLTVPLLYWPM